MQLIFSELEGERELKFRNKHWKKCESSVYFTLTNCGIGWGVVVTCKYCGKSKNITDTGDW